MELSSLTWKSSNQHLFFALGWCGRVFSAFTGKAGNDPGYKCKQGPESSHSIWCRVFDNISVEVALGLAFCREARLCGVARQAQSIIGFASFEFQDDPSNLSWSDAQINMAVLHKSHFAEPPFHQMRSAWWTIFLTRKAQTRTQWVHILAHVFGLVNRSRVNPGLG